MNILCAYYIHINMLSNKYAESYKYDHIMNIICSYLYVVVYWDNLIEQRKYCSMQIAANLNLFRYCC